jgi:hypothetical protein
MSRPRHKRKRPLAERNGERVRVTRLTKQGDVVEYDATLSLEIDDDGILGRVFLERLRLVHAFARLGAWWLFKAAVDLPIPGYPDWFQISGVPVELSRHTRRRTHTRGVMDMLGYAPTAGFRDKTSHED